MSDEENAPDHPLTLVGVGASAGGLAAFEALIGALPHPLPPPLSFVLIQHLAPQYESTLPQLIRRKTSLPVREIEDGMSIEPRVIYVAPPAFHVAVRDERLWLTDASRRREGHLTIDAFFESLAEAFKERSVAIVLSGSGSDGALGVRAIKAANGLVIAQEPSSAQHSSMPATALSTETVDLELRPEAIPEKLIAYVEHARRLEPNRASSSEADEILDELLGLLRDQTGRDFSGYKRNTMRRRTERRMALHQLASLDQYLDLLRSSPEEIDVLGRELFIGVTGFFRDPEAFAALEDTVIPEILAQAPPGQPVRVWVAGCSTGEEAYSVAMLLTDAQAPRPRRRRVQIFATDADERAIARARQGLFPTSTLTALSQDRRERFFIPEHYGPEDQITAFRVKKAIRDTIIFSEQNVLEDAPFSRLDLIVCRNLLIYLGAPLQRKLVSLFHYALNPGGYLFLGTSETAGEQTELFVPIRRDAKIYRKGEVERRLAPPLPARSSAEVHTRSPHDTASPKWEGSLGGLSMKTITERALLEHVSPAAVLVDQRGDILYVHARTGLYLELLPGESRRNNVLEMAREGLHQPLELALKEASQRRELVIRRDVVVRTNGEKAKVDLIVQPLALDTTPADYEQVYLAAFETRGEVAATLADDPNAAEEDADDASRIVELEARLAEKEEYLQSTREQLETSNEELKSTNEELQSMNEELQSTNEELETSKEELQSINEELTTTNTELQSKVEELSHANNDMNNLLAGTGVATIFVDPDMRILRFTPAASRIVRLIPGDIGRPLGDLAGRFETYSKLVDDTRSVLDTLIPRRADLQTQDGAWYSMRIAPYRTLENVIQGAVLIFVDITEQRRVESELERDRQRLQMALAVAPIRLYAKDLSLAFTWASAPILGVPPEEIGGKFNLDVLQTEQAASEWTAAENEALKSGHEVRRNLRIGRAGEDRTLVAVAEPSRDAQGRIEGLNGAMLESRSTESSDPKDE